MKQRMSLKTDNISTLTDNIGKAKILILGDVMLDEYLFGSVSRISPEAPVPVVEITSSKLLLGGAANVAANIKSLGDEPILLGTVGEDEASIKLTQLLKAKGIRSDFIVHDLTRQTTIKTRVIAHSQQVVRTDVEDRKPLDDIAEDSILKRFRSVADEIKAVIISDYGKGVITPSIMDKIMQTCLERDIYVAVDPLETNFQNYKKVSVITPNHHEAGFAYGRRILDEKDLLEVGNGLMRKFETKSILITRGPQGMSLFEDGVEPTHIPTFARQVYDVTGAGDTVIATFVSAICAGANSVEASIIANAGAGVTVREVGTATVNIEQLREELMLNLKNGNLSAALRA